MHELYQFTLMATNLDDMNVAVLIIIQAYLKLAIHYIRMLGL